MAPMVELEHALVELVDELRGEHVVNGSTVTCYVGRERRELDEALIVFRQVRTYAGRLDQVAAPVPDGQVEIDGATYVVAGVIVYATAFQAEIYRRR